MPTRSILLAAALLAAAPLAAQSADTAWSDLYLRDLAEARRVIAENHPGPVDTMNHDFAHALDSAYAAAVARAPQVRDYDGFAVALQMFGNSFQDAHLNVAGRRTDGTVRDAGVRTRYVHGTLEVVGTDARYNGRIAPGATVLDCDGVSSGVLLDQRVLSWRGRRGITADRYTHAPLLLVDFGPPSPAAPRACRFASGGDTVDVALDWRAGPRAGVLRAAAEANDFPQQRLSVRRDGDMLWVQIPTFAVRGDDIALMERTIETLASELRSGTRTDLVVIDLRGNSGGSSSWGDRIAGHLFGSEWLAAAKAYLNDGTYTEWRVSRDNIATLEQLVRQVEEQGNANGAAGLRVLRDSMVAAQRRGATLIANPGSVRDRSGVEKPRRSQVPYQVVAITSASCFSACLDFMDLMRAHGAATHVGQPTGVDTDYMENWGQTLPSGVAGVGYPMKVYRHRRRANNHGYIPHVAHDDVHDTAALERWIRENRASWR